jgi:hypothetical protein
MLLFVVLYRNLCGMINDVTRLLFKRKKYRRVKLSIIYDSFLMFKM